jgi:hypothetical protein
MTQNISRDNKKHIDAALSCYQQSQRVVFLAIEVMVVYDDDGGDTAEGVKICGIPKPFVASKAMAFKEFGEEGEEKREEVVEEGRPRPLSMICIPFFGGRGVR